LGLSENPENPEPGLKRHVAMLVQS